MLAEEEPGYPHELILRAFAESMSVIQGHYRMRVKLLANLLRHILKEKRVDFKGQIEDDPFLRILAGLVEGVSSSIKEEITEYREKLNDSLEDFEKTQSAASYSEFTDLLREGVFLHILCKEIKNSPLFVKEDIAKFSKALDDRENKLRAVFSAIQISDNQTYDFVPHNLMFEFASFTEGALNEVAIFLSYNLAVKYPKSKGQLLVVHYVLVKNAVENFKGLNSRQDLGDQVFENLFHIAIVLVLCGYLETLRLPNEEKIQYLEKVIQLPSIEYSVKKIFDGVATIPIPRVQLRVPLWLLLAISSVLLVFHWYWDIYLPLEMSQLGLKLTVPNVPIFLTFAFVLSVIVLFRVYRLRSNIIKSLRRGEVEHQEI